MEFKMFFHYLIEDLELAPSTLYYKASAFDRLVSFLNIKYPNIKSMSEISKEKCLFEFRDWLSHNGFKETIQVTRLNENMEEKTYNTISVRTTFVRQLYEYLYPKNNDLKEKEKDKWDIRNLDIYVKVKKSRPRYTINFKQIKQSYLKNLAKEYVYHRLQVRELSTVFDDMKGINYLSRFITECYSDIETLEHIDREFVEDLVGYIKTSGLTKYTASQRIGQINTFFNNIILMGLENSPKTNYIIESDYKGKYSPKVEHYSDEELNKINSCMRDMPIEIARMLYVLESVGMRINELCLLEKSCLIKQSEENYILRYYQDKTSKWNTIPINNEVSLILKEAIKDSNEKHGEDCKYIFPIRNDKPISVDSFSYYVNKALHKNQVLNDEGEPLRVKAHSFRRTLATRFINMSIEPDMIALMLGQKSIKSLKHYIEIHDETMIEYLKPITEKQNKMIENIGNSKYFKDNNKEQIISNNDKLIPLSNGFCSKSIKEEICDHANACYTCRMFIPSKSHINTYKMQLSQAKANISIAKNEGYKRIEDANIKLIKNLEKVINEI